MFTLKEIINLFSGERTSFQIIISLLIILIIFFLIVFLEKKTMCFKNIKGINPASLKKIIAFSFAILVYFIFTSGQNDMILTGSDSEDIWRTIKSWYSEEIYGSYVLYKGINSVYPYVWLLKLSQFLHFNEFFFIRLLFCAMFAYIAAIGFPNLIELLTKKETDCYRRCLLALLFWFFWNYSRAFTIIMVDLPCLVYFLLLVNASLKVYRGKVEANLYHYTWIGLLAGLNMSASGQYTIPAICILIFTSWVSIKKCNKNKCFQLLFCRLLLLFVCCWVVTSVNDSFEKNYVNPLRNNGSWIPSGQDWLQAGLVRFKEAYRAGGGSLTIPSYRVDSIFQDYFAEDHEVTVQNRIEVRDYIALFFKYPADFILKYLNSMFLVLSPDWGKFNFTPLFIFYSLTYVSLLIGVKRCKTWKTLFSSLCWIGLAFIWTTVPQLVMNIEQRTCLQVQGLIIALAICDNTMWDYIRRVLIVLIKKVHCKEHASINKIPYTAIFYVIFIIFCFMHISTLYEMIGVNAEQVLIRF